MPVRQTAKLIWGCLYLTLLFGMGCDQVVPQNQPQPVDVAQRDDAEEVIIPGNGPIRRTDEPLNTPLLEGLKQQIEQMPASEEADGVVRQLSEQLSDADALYSEAKRKNRLAIQQANRQVRIGAAKQSPNLVLITVDRLGIGDLGCYGQTHWQTPRLDELAKSGARFTSFYAGSCDSPASRQCLLTGRLALSNHSSQMANSLPRVLWNAGYKTALMGDWSIDSSLGSQGYEDWSGWNSPTNEHPDWAELNGRRITLEDNLNGGSKVRKAEFLLSEVRSFVGDRRNRGNQFFLHVALNLFAVPDLPTISRAEYEQKIQNADELVGGVLDILQELGLTNHTCVCFTADSGPHPALSSVIRESRSVGDFRFSDHGLCEGNLRVPCIIRWPHEIPTGFVADAAIGAWDVLPTFAALALGTDADQPLASEAADCRTAICLAINICQQWNCRPRRPLESAAADRLKL
ncbi:MAG: aslA [Planctomycetota bacterium]|nr:MAG: aslA [Planctomycetota bacterium]